MQCFVYIVILTCRLGQVLCAEGLECMKIQNYYDWFRAGVAHWLDIAIYKALKRIDRAVDFDTLQPVDSSVQYSSSAVDTLTIFYQIKVFWTQLAWPDVEGSYTFIAKIIDVGSSDNNTIHFLYMGKHNIIYHNINLIDIYRTSVNVQLSMLIRWQRKLRK